jgi:hypothetical protein
VIHADKPEFFMLTSYYWQKSTSRPANIAVGDNEWQASDRVLSLVVIGHESYRIGFYNTIVLDTDYKAAVTNHIFRF